MWEIFILFGRKISNFDPIFVQERAGGESCTLGTELELGENIVDSYGKVGRLITGKIWWETR